MRDMPAISSTVTRPVETQVPMRPTAGSVQVKPPSQARVTESSPTARRNVLR